MANLPIFLLAICLLAPEPFCACRQASSANSQQADQDALLSITFSSAGGGHLLGAKAQIQFLIDDQWQAEEVRMGPQPELNYQLKPGTKDLRIIVTAPGHVPYCLQRDNQRSKLIVPTDLHVTLQRGRTVTGVVKDADGNPIEGAIVKLTMKAQDADDRTSNLAFEVQRLTTDAKGQWSFNGAPFDLKVAQLNANVEHPDFLPAKSSRPSYAGDGSRYEANLQQGVSYSARVYGQWGSPLQGANVTLGSSRMSAAESIRSDDEGEVRFTACRPGKDYLVIEAVGYAPQLFEMTVYKAQTELAVPMIPMETGKRLTGRVVDAAGQGISGATVSLYRWRDKLLPLDKNLITDEKGQFVWEKAPTDEIVYSVFKDGFLARSEVTLKADASNEPIELIKVPEVIGKVTDSSSGKLLPKIWVMYGYSEEGNLDSIRWTEGPKSMAGNFTYKLKEHQGHYFLRIGSQGYGSVVRKFTPNQELIELDVSLKSFESWKDQAWEPIRIAMDEGQISMELGEVVETIREFGATIEWSPESPDIWNLHLADKHQINSAMHDRAIQTEDEAQRTWMGNLEDISAIGNLPSVKLKLEGFLLNTELLAQLAKLTNVKSLKLYNCPLDLLEDDCSAFAKLVHLEELSLDGRWQDLPEQVLESVAGLPNLKMLEVNGTFHITTQAVAKHLPKLKQVRRLKLSSNDGFTPEIAEALTKLEKLESVSIEGKAIDDSFVDGLVKLPLRELDLSRTSLSDRGLIKLAENLPTLEKLNVIRTKVTADGFRSIGERLPNLVRLELDEVERPIMVQFQLLHPNCRIFQQIHIRNGVVAAGLFRLTDAERAAKK